MASITIKTREVINFFKTEMLWIIFMMSEGMDVSLTHSEIDSEAKNAIRALGGVTTHLKHKYFQS